MEHMNNTKETTNMHITQLLWLNRPSMGRHLKPPKFEHIFVAVITFLPFLLCIFFLLIVCALR